MLEDARDPSLDGLSSSNASQAMLLMVGTIWLRPTTSAKHWTVSLAQSFADLRLERPHRRTS
ncbi:hypothetical protein U1Q18_028055, partial [Sarracenia purpurea var. burkii]